MLTKRATDKDAGKMKPTLRRATMKDAPELAQIHVAAWHEAYRGTVPDSFLEQFTVQRRLKRFQEFLADNSAETYIVEYESRIVGFLTLGGCRDEGVERSTTGEIWGIYIRPAYWRRGFGRFLCQQGQNRLAAQDFSIATLWVLEANKRARSFYQAMGFKADGTRKVLQFGIPVPAIRYRKNLR
jgi:ribosomal protein S18 acetylase RimI-like enzyme